MLGLFTDIEGQYLQTKEEEEDKFKVRRKFLFLISCLFIYIDIYILRNSNNRFVPNLIQKEYSTNTDLC